MPTRAFVLDGPPKRFWDISWDGPVVEITSGKWGSDGRVREISFESASARDAFVAAEIAKAKKKGFLETNQIAPAADVSSANAAAVASIRALVESRRTPAWRPIFEPGDARSGDAFGTVRGPMTLDPEEPWPTCPRCHSPLTGLFELDLARVPADALRNDSVLQLFWCEAWEQRDEGDVCTVNGGHLARRHRRGGEKRVRSSLRGVPSAIVDFVRYEEVPFHDAEISARFAAASTELIEDLLRSVGGTLEGTACEYDGFVRALGLMARNEHKLGGFATFVQDYQEPFVRQIFQIEQNAPFDVNFGDLGAGHLLLGESDAIQFTWASH